MKKIIKIIRSNWKNPASYKDLEKISLNQWAWEFLRRNPKYIEDWENYHDQDSDLKISFKWGISGLLKDPNKIYNDIKNDPDGIGFDPPGGYETTMLGTLKDNRKLMGMPNFDTGEQNFEFNFFEPINPQIKRVKEMLLRLQKRAKEMKKTTRKAFKPRCDEWILLVRILDAKAAGAKDKEIADVLFPDEQSEDINIGIKKVYDKFKQAKKYIEHDYLLIPYSEE